MTFYHCVPSLKNILHLRFDVLVTYFLNYQPHLFLFHLDFIKLDTVSRLKRALCDHQQVFKSVHEDCTYRHSHLCGK